jgi:hypothetical protein
MSKSELVQLRAEFPRHREAVAYQGSDFIGVANLNLGTSFALDTPYSNRRHVAMRIGRGPLNAMMGLWSPGEEFVTATTIESHPPQTLAWYDRQYDQGDGLIV